MPGLAVTEPENGNGQRTSSIQLQQSLEHEKRRIEERLADHRQQLASPNRKRSAGDHSADLEIMSESELQEKVLFDQGILDKINQALNKIKDGTYGICDDCKNFILQKRLEVLPSACCCVDCQREKETKEKNGETPVFLV